MHKRAILTVFAAAGALSLLACGSSHHASTGGGGTGSGAGGGGGSTTTTSTGPCTEAWACTPWETDGTSDAATRTCTDANACGTTKSKPIESAMLPPLDLDAFKCNVEPILDRKCAQLGCHGTETGRALRVYARGRRRLAGQMLSNAFCGPGSTPSDGCLGANHCLCVGPHTDAEWRKNFDAARGFALDSTGKMLTSTKLDKSEILAQPVVGGLPHAGIHLFVKNDAEYAQIKNWLSGAKLGMPCNTGVN